jgi:hypothetical protein
MPGYDDPSNPFPRYPFTLASLLGTQAKAQKRKVYFAFHFADIMRVNNVRQAWKIDHPDAPAMRSFYDSSLWEKRQLEGPESVKNLIRGGVEYTSAVCVLVGSDTWARRWVRYEIARAVIDNRGLLAVHLNNIRHHVSRQPDVCGPNPLEFMCVGKVQPNEPSAFSGQRNSLAAILGREPVKYYLFERTNQGWVRYQDYTIPVDLPRYLADPQAGYLMPLSTGTVTYDFVNEEGHKNVGTWIDQAAQQVGR